YDDLSVKHHIMADSFERFGHRLVIIIERFTAARIKLNFSSLNPGDGPVAVPLVLEKPPFAREWTAGKSGQHGFDEARLTVACTFPAFSTLSGGAAAAARLAPVVLHFLYPVGNGIFTVVGV